MKQARQILVVEADWVSRGVLQRALAQSGYEVTTAADVIDVRRQLLPATIGSFDGVVAGCRILDTHTVELLAWIKERDANLATILVTDGGERQLVTASPSGDAVTFLERPIELEKLRDAVAQAVERTQRQRHLAKSETAIKELRRAQEWMLGADVLGSPVRVEVCFHPKHEAGGDFFSRFRPAPNHLFFLLTDVSGHDLQAAYISAYFQGVVRGMLERAAQVEEIFAAFNRFLLEEWVEDGACGRQPVTIDTSVAACAILIDSLTQTAKVLTHGTPAPVYWRSEGDAQVVGETGGFPLGWFPGSLAQGVVQSIAGGGSFCLWTDGLEEVAERRGVSALSLACALHRAKARGQKLVELDTAADDILVADIHLVSEHLPAGLFRPLILEQYHGGQAGEIDELQAFWRRSLTLAVPELPEARLHDVLLASREALLNALVHGCGGSPELRASFQAAYSASANSIRVRVGDPGPGHHFDLAQRLAQASQELVERHHGLILVKHLANTLEFERNGASVIMDFDWPSPPPS